METKKEKDMLECKLNNFINKFLVQPINKCLIHPINKCLWQPLKKIFLKPVKSFFKNVIWILIFAGLGVLFLFSAKAYKNDKEKITDIQKQQHEIRQKFEQNMDKVLVLKSKIIDVKANDSIQKIWESEMYNNQKEMLDLKQELNEQHEETQAELQSLWMHQMEYFAALIALIVAVVFFKTLEHQAKEKIQEEIAKMTGRELDVISSNYDEYVRHKNLKQDSKILVIQKKGTSMPDIFQRVMQFFNVNLDENSSNLISLDKLNEYQNHLEQLKQADVVIIENQTGNNAWELLPGSSNIKLDELKDKKETVLNEQNAYITLKDILEGQPVNANRISILQKVFSGFSRKNCNPVDIAMMLFNNDLIYRNNVLDRDIIRKNLRFDVRLAFNWMEGTGILKDKLIEYLDKIIKDKQTYLEQLKNTLTMAEMANRIGSNGKTALLYYGKGQFPIHWVKHQYQHLVTFANAPSQLYGNLLNMLKFKYELEKIKS